MASQNPMTKQGSGANAVKANAGAARSTALGSAEGCSLCKRKGVPILPLRYAVIPGYLQAGRGAASFKALFGGSRESALGQVPALEEHRYTIRTLREGYVYVYLDKPGQWQVYAVTPDGNLRLFADPDDMDEKAGKEMSAQCKRSGDNIPASFIHVRDPAKTPFIWLAFSTARWTKAVRQGYEKNPVKRMQKFDCKQLDSAPDAVPDAFELNNEASKRLSAWVEEYIGPNDAETTRRAYTTRKVGDVESNRFVWDSIHGHRFRAGQSEALANHAKCYQAQHGEKHKVAAVVLHDAMGIVQEINGQRAHQVKARQNYCERVLRPLTISQSILGLKKVIEASALATRTKTEKAEGTPDTVTTTVFYPSPMMAGESETETSTRAERVASDVAATWGKLADRYSETKRKEFEDGYRTTLKVFNEQVTAADADWRKWADDPGWHAWLDDYDPSEIAQRVQMTIDCAPCLAGGVIDTGSFEIWKKWFGAKADSKENPVYRGLFGNEKTLLAYLVPQDGAVNKGDMLYGHATAIADSKEFEKHITDRLRLATVDIQLAIAGATSEVENRMRQAGQALSSAVHEVATKAQQIAILILEKVEVTLLKVQLTVGAYQRLMSDLAFESLDKAKRAAYEVIDGSGRRLRNFAMSGGEALGINRADVREKLVEFTMWTYGKADDLKKAIAEATDKSKAIFDQMSSTASRAVRGFTAHALTLNSKAIKALESVVVKIPLGQALRFSRSITSKAFRLGGGGGMVLVAGSLYFQKWAIQDSMKELKSKLGPLAVEAQLAVTCAWVGTIGVVAGAVGGVIEEAGKMSARTSLLNAGKVVSKIGATIGAVAAVVDGVQCSFAAGRTGGKGDGDAAALYAGAAAVYFIAAGFGSYAAIVGSSALLGPLGIALGLIVVGAILAWAALNAEDTQAEIWLDRCYFGLGKRAEGKWNENQSLEELSELNSILVGLSAQMGFSDSWLGLEERITGYETIDMEIKFGAFDTAKSVYKWRLFARHEGKKKEFEISAGEHGLLSAQQFLSALPTDDKVDKRNSDTPDKWFRNWKRSESKQDGAWVVRESVEVQRTKFQNARLQVDYWPDYDSGSTKASLSLTDQD